MSPGMLLSTGYIAGGTIAGVLISFLAFSDTLPDRLAIGKNLPLSDDHGADYFCTAGRISRAGRARMVTEDEGIERGLCFSITNGVPR